MATAVPYIGQVIVSVLVSKVVTKVGEKIGLSDSMASLIGAGVGIYAGAQVPGAIGGADAGPEAGMDLTTGMQDLGGQLDPGGVQAPVAPSTAITPEMNTGGPGTPGARPGGGNVQKVAGGPGTPGARPGGGLLSQGVQVPKITPEPNVGQPSTAKSVIQQTVGNKPNVTPSYWEKLFSPDKTMDMIMSGVGGMAKQDIAREDREYDEEVARANAQGWVNAGTGGLSQIRTTSPGQGYLSNYQ